MARFLSPEWFEALDAAGPESPRSGDGRPEGTDPAEGLVLEQVVTGTPEGDVSYVVVASGGRSRVVPPGRRPPRPPDLTLTSDWPTAVEVAQGRLSTQRAFMQGRLRVRGSLTRLPADVGGLAGLDPVPEAVRHSTTY